MTEGTREAGHHHNPGLTALLDFIASGQSQWYEDIKLKAKMKMLCSRKPGETNHLCLEIFDVISPFTKIQRDELNAELFEKEHENTRPRRA